MNIAPRIALFAALAATVFAVGCAASNPMVGTWKLELSDEFKKQMKPGMSADMSFTFKGDNTWESTSSSTGSSAGSSNVSVSGTYTLKEKALTMVATKQDGKEMKGPDLNVTLSDDMKSFKMPGGEMLGTIKKQ